MADECIMSMPEYDGLDYTMKEYMRYVEYVKSCVERLNSQSPGEFFYLIFNQIKVFLVLKAISNNQTLLKSYCFSISTCFKDFTRDFSHLKL